MSRIEIKIGGTITDDSELDQIQKIAKVFAYEQRMKQVCYENVSSESTLKKPNKKYLLDQKSTSRKEPSVYIPICQVRGLT